MISGTRVALLATVAGAGISAVATGRPAAREADAPADHIANVERLTAGGGAMITDNARYAGRRLAPAARVHVGEGQADAPLLTVGGVRAKETDPGR